MKSILLKFLTRNGEQAYHKVDAEGKDQSFMDKQIAKKVATDHVLSKKPLIIKIKIKISWLAVKVDLPKQIRQGLKKYGAEEDKDYTIEVRT